ncbi:MAG: universal stress protein [Deltaproteobacteria bacterium]|nr:universal stress protein [Deltaproteobacteria bacterium]MBW1952577.1 universal stress protein [Deltaproteobacteria bacterium]MBW1986144.1 universal stress protein [Deltaproteobacteria bacterium]MBW2134170.1 universal stress protein [Deltaproteobacteria bacterium]
MARYSKILVAVDGSEPSLHALKESLRLSKDGLIAVSVAPRYEGDLRITGGQSLSALLAEPCERALGQAQKLAETEGAQISTACMVGEPYEEIVDLAEREKVDLIVMGRSGHSFLARTLIGSNTRRVIGYSPVHVLVVPPQATLNWQKILLPTDGSKYSQKAAERAVDFAKSYGGELTVVSVFDLCCKVSGPLPAVDQDMLSPIQGYVDEVKSLAEAEGIKTEGLVRQGRAEQIILDLVTEQKIDLVIMGSHGRTGLDRLLMGSVTERIIGNSTCPVLVVK